jgi:hypothetical protein
MANTRPRKRQKTQHVAQSVMLMTTIALMQQYSQEEVPRPTKRRRLSAPAPYAPSLDEVVAAEGMLLLASVIRVDTSVG